MSAANKTLLVIEKRVKLAPDAVQALEESGFVVVRGTPADFHVVGNHPPLSDPLVLDVALRTIQNVEGGYISSNDVRWQFARNLAAALGYADTVRMK